MDTRVYHRRVNVDGVDTFYREAGSPEAPVVLLPHGDPCSSYEFRNLMPRLADKWRTVAPDYPGFGYSSTPEDFDYSFDGYARWLNHFVETLSLERFAIYLHDFGSPIGARLAQSVSWGRSSKMAIYHTRIRLVLSMPRSKRPGPCRMTSYGPQCETR